MPKKECFVIAPIGEPESETRKRSDLILKYVINPAVEKCGYRATRSDKISEPGMISSQVIQHIVDDPLVIADLTEMNPNVFYELAIRHVICKPFVQIIKKGEQIPFDVSGARTIYVDHQDLESVEEAKSEIIAQIQSLESDLSKLETPISVSLDLQSLKQSDNPEQRSLADVLSVISDLRTTVGALEERLKNPESLLPPQYLHRALEDLRPRPHRSRGMAVELRRIMDELVDLNQSDGLRSVESIHIQNRIIILRNDLDRIMHREEW